jgi:hypothetical protein
MGKSILLDCILVCIAKPELFVLPWWISKSSSLGGYTTGAKHNWIAWVAPVDMSSVQKPT